MYRFAQCCTSTVVNIILSFLNYAFLFISSSAFLYVRFFIVWIMVLTADFLLEFRFEYLWPFWLLLRSAYDSFKYQGLVSFRNLNLPSVVSCRSLAFKVIPGLLS